MIDGVLCFRQSDDSRCGPAVVKAILYYYGIDITEDDAAKACRHSYEDGCTNEDIVDALRGYGLGATIYPEATLSDLKYWTRHKIPVIIDWFSETNGHSSIVVGVDREYVHIVDPEYSYVRKIAVEEFMRVWFDWEGDNELQQDSTLVLRTIIVPHPNRLR